MALTTDNIKYNSGGTTITCTLANLATSSAQTVGRQSTVVYNTGTLYDDVLVTVMVKTQPGAIGSTKSVLVYLFGSEDGTIYDGDDALVGGTDAAYTVGGSGTNLKGPVVISCLSSAKQYVKTFSVASFWGGIMPVKWGLVVINDTGQSLDGTETNHQKSYTGITFTNQ